MRRRHIVLVVGIIVAAALMGGAALLSRPDHAQRQSPPPTAKHVVTKTLAHPSSTPVSASNYISTAAPNEPSYISLPAIGTAGYIQNVGVDQYGQMAAPTNVHLAGWYVNSLLPGQAGLSVIDGHVDGYYHNQGIFGSLNKLKTGDVFTVTFGDGSKKSFAVKSSQLVDTDIVPSILFAHDPTITSQLNLITCGGGYDGVSHTYDQRTIVISALIK